ncbi:ufd1 [Scenedesmus sp. PABB004]|nr:ufd1 [Scenedesmus sp. PABB004]
MEFKAAADKLRKEQAARAERERQRIEKERVAAERQRAREEAREAAARARRLEAAAAAAAEEARHAADLEENRGVSLRVSLAAAPAREGEAAARGIRRAADKLVLPPSVGAALLDQGAPKNGAMLFEVAASNGASTHAGVLEFNAPEGVVLLPAKVANCLWGLPGAGGSDDGGGAGGGGGASGGRFGCAVHVRYKRLPTGTYVRLQPELRAFHDVVGSDPDALRGALEECLRGCATLSEGDWVQVPYAGELFNLRVLELQPAPAVSVLETDIAADVGPSIETEGYMRAREEAETREAERARQLHEQAARAAAQALAAEEAAAAAAAERVAAEQARRLAVRAEKAALVAPEPPAGGGQPAATLLFRLPDGARLSRRFLLEQRLQELYDFVDSEGAGGLWPGTYALVQQFPRRVLPPGGSDGGGETLAGAGFAAGQQQALLLEALPERHEGGG